MTATMERRQRDQRIVELRRQGMPLAEIKRVMGCSISMIKHALRRDAPELLPKQHGVPRHERVGIGEQGSATGSVS